MKRNKKKEDLAGSLLRGEYKVVQIEAYKSAKGREPDESGINDRIIIYTSLDNSILLCSHTVHINDSVQGQLVLRQTPSYMPTLSKQTFVASSPH